MVEGELIMGRFTVGERIGGGGHGTVHRAWDERLCRWVAVKAVEGDDAGRVLREAHAAARLNHPGIVTLYELGRQNDCAYLVSELVEGPDLRRQATDGSISDREVAEIGAELCSALAHAHAAGVVHRDIKPDNVLVRRRGGRFSRESGERAKLADFGIASLDDGTKLTATGQVLGTLAYMSPEQALGEEAGPESDVYSLALTLYELWAGENPVRRSTPAATARAIGEEVPGLEEYRPELPAELCEAIDAALDPDPTARPSVEELRETLLALRGALHPDRAVPEPVDPAAHSTLPPEVPARPFAILLGAGALALAGSLAGLPGLAIVAAALLAPAALFLSRPSEWLLPALAPLLGVLGGAPAFLAVAARHERVAGRAALAALGWAWTGVVGAVTGHALGVPVPIESTGWASSGPIALDDVLGPLLSPTGFAIGLIWVGGAILLGILLDVAKPAGAAIGGLIWAAVVASSLTAAGPAAVPSPILAPALMLAVGWAIWDRQGRPEFAHLLPGRRLAGRAMARVPRLPGPAVAAETAPAPPRSPRNPATKPLPDERSLATRRAAQHVRAALHGAGSRGGLP